MKKFFKNLAKHFKKIESIRLRIALSYVTVIVIGTLLYASGVTMKDFNPISLIDAFFTSTTAFSVSGLSVIPRENFNLFGHIVTIILMELGGIGVMAFKLMIFMFIGQKINVADRLLISVEQHQNNPAGMVKLLKVSVIIFFVAQIILTILLGIDLLCFKGYSLIDALGYGAYHSVSTINSAGFDILPGTFTSLNQDYYWQIVVMIGLFIGGIGFPTLYEFYLAFKNKRKKKAFKHSLYFKVNITSYFVIFGLALIAILIAEKDNILAQYPNVKGVFYVLFQTFSYRSAGFQTISLESFTHGSQFIFTILMFIGVGAASTGGGIRETTLAIIFLCFISFMKGKENVEVFNRRLTAKTINNSFIVISFAIMLIGLATVSILLQSSNTGIFEALYEATSAFGTVGTTLGVTEQLNTFNKILIAILMIIGRLSIIGTLLLFTSRKNASTLVKSPEENITIG